MLSLSSETAPQLQPFRPNSAAWGACPGGTATEDSRYNTPAVHGGYVDAYLSYKLLVALAYFNDICCPSNLKNAVRIVYVI